MAWIAEITHCPDFNIFCFFDFKIWFSVKQEYIYGNGKSVFLFEQFIINSCVLNVDWFFITRGLTPPPCIPGAGYDPVRYYAGAWMSAAVWCWAVFSAECSIAPPLYKSGWNAREWAIKSSAGLATSGESKLSFYMLSHWQYSVVKIHNELLPRR